MISWLLLLGGLLIWAVHFGGVYVISSFADVFDHAGSDAARLLVGLLTGAALLGNVGLLALAASREAHFAKDSEAMPRFINAACALGAFFSLIAVLWQGLPALIIGR